MVALVCVSKLHWLKVIGTSLFLITKWSLVWGFHSAVKGLGLSQLSARNIHKHVTYLRSHSMAAIPLKHHVYPPQPGRSGTFIGKMKASTVTAKVDYVQIHLQELQGLIFFSWTQCYPEGSLRSLVRTTESGVCRKLSVCSASDLHLAARLVKPHRKSPHRSYQTLS